MRTSNSYRPTLTQAPRPPAAPTTGPTVRRREGNGTFLMLPLLSFRGHYGFQVDTEHTRPHQTQRCALPCGSLRPTTFLVVQVLAHFLRSAVGGLKILTYKVGHERARTTNNQSRFVVVMRGKPGRPASPHKTYDCNGLLTPVVEI
jgi:hypothetical protein